MALLAALVLTSTASAIGLPNLTTGQGSGTGRYLNGYLGFSTLDFGARVTLVDSQTGQKINIKNGSPATYGNPASVDYINKKLNDTGYIGDGYIMPKIYLADAFKVGGLCKSDYVLGGVSINPYTGWNYQKPPEPFTDETQTSRLNLGEDFSVLPRTLNVGGGKIYAFCETLQKFL